MNSFIRIALIPGMFLIFNSAYSQSWTADFNWLEGIWNHENGKVTERWDMEPDYLDGMVFDARSRGMKIYEVLKIVKREDEVFYIADVEHNPEPVAFLLTHLEKHRVIFENPQHDFPQKIEYSRLHSDTLRVTLSNLETTNSFLYIRSPNDRD